MLFGSNIQLLQRARRINKPQLFNKGQPPFVSTGALGAIFLRGLYPLLMEPARLVATVTMHAIPDSLIDGIGYRHTILNQ